MPFSAKSGGAGKMLGGVRNASAVWNIVRETNLNEIKGRIERRFGLLVVGEAADAEALARALSQRPGQTGIHPWVAMARLPLAADQLPFKPDLVLLVTRHADLDAGEADAIKQLSRQGAQVLTVVTGEAANRVGAGLPRGMERARVALADLTDTIGLKKQLAPALIAAADQIPDLPLSLARHLWVLRDPVLESLVEDTSRANATFALTTSVGEMVPGLNIPLALGDSIVLTKNQLIMAFKIALVAGKPGEPRALMGEVASVIGGGLLFRQIARELAGLIPVVGAVPKVAVAYAGTRAIGLTVQLWALEDRRPSREELGSWYQQAMERGRALAAHLVERARHRRPALPDHGRASTRLSGEPSTGGGISGSSAISSTSAGDHGSTYVPPAASPGRGPAI